jgi:RNA polymerase sigma-70 factor (ECF subfamily)
VTTQGLDALLLSHLGPPRRDEVAAIGQLAAILVAQHADGAATWPTVALSAERYIAHLAERVTARASEPAERVIRSMPAADLYLAAACADRDPAALVAFRDMLVPTLRQALGKLAMPPATIDETVQRVLLMLFVGDGSAPQIHGYGGRGTLRSWLRTIGVRTGRRLLGVEHDAARGDDELAALPARIVDPELALLRDRYRDEVRRAFAAAFAGLTERQRNVLRQYHLDELTIDQLAAMYQINRATAARWVAAARLAVITATRAQLAATLGVSSTEIDSIIRLVRSQLDVSVRELTG